MVSSLALGEPTLTLTMEPAIHLSDEDFFAFCQLNPELHIERTAEGEIVIMTPAGGEAGQRNSELNADLTFWARQDGTGLVFDSSTGFVLPDGSTRSPDASWVRRDRWSSLTATQRKQFPPLCPDFVVELRSPTDSLRALQGKMEEYIANGAQLGWLLDPEARRVYVYRPGEAEAVLDNPATLSGDPVLPGFILDLSTLWDVDL